jgi:aminoglycoside 6'-N-acetyltransferase I
MSAGETSVRVRPLEERDRGDWLRMRDALWPGSPSDHDADIQRYFDGTQGQLLVLVAELDGRIVGFLELDERKYAPGCDASPVAFVEGWYVDADARGRGVGRALIEAAEATARAEGHLEIASDTELDNADAIAAHLALGFEEIERVVCLRKSLRAD